MRPYWIRMYPNPTTGILIRRKNRNMQTETQKEESHVRMRVQSEYTRQGTPRFPGSHQKLE